MFSPYDLHRLQRFAAGNLGLLFVFDLFPNVALLLLTGRVPCGLTHPEAQLLLEAGLRAGDAR